MHEIPLVQGFEGYVSIQDLNGEELFKQNVQTGLEAKQFVERYGQSIPGCPMWKACLIPLRTENWQNFAKDLFLPTFIHRALKVDNLIMRMIASLFAIILDVATLPIRFLTAPFRVYVNLKNPSTHPIEELIKDKPNAKPAFREGLVYIINNMSKVEIQRDEVLELRTAKKKAVDQRVLVVFKRYHGNREEKKCDVDISEYYELENYGWDLQSHYDFGPPNLYFDV